MRTLKESLLDDENILINDQASMKDIIEDWCNTHIMGFKNFGSVTNDLKVNLKSNYNWREVRFFNLENEDIPDGIKWGDTKKITINIWNNIKSFKNFPTEFEKLIIKLQTSIKDFSTMPKNINIGTIELQESAILSLKGLIGKVKILYISNNKFKEFDSNSKLNIDYLTIDVLPHGSLSSFDNLPKIYELRIKCEDYNLETKLKKYPNLVTGKEKITWKKLIAPNYFKNKLENITYEITTK